MEGVPYGLRAVGCARAGAAASPKSERPVLPFGVMNGTKGGAAPGQNPWGEIHKEEVKESNRASRLPELFLGKGH